MDLSRSEFIKLVAAGAGYGLLGGRSEAGNEGGESEKFLRAVEQGDAGRVKSFLERAPGLAASRDGRGRSALVLAYLGGHPEIGELLRPHLPPLDAIEAILVGDGDRLRALLQETPELLDRPHPIGGRPAHVAARFGRSEMMFGLIASDFSALSTDPPGRTALRLAAECADRDAAEIMVEALASNSADPNVPQEDGVSPLHAAAAAGSLEMIRVLIFNGARTDARSRRGATPLEAAEQNGRKEAAELLRRAAALPRHHRSSRFAYTAGGEAYKAPDPASWPESRYVQEYVGVSHGNRARMLELLAARPNLLLANAPWNELAVEAGAHVGNREIVQIQLDRGAPCSICTAAMMGKTAFVQRLLKEDPRRIWECGAHNMPLLWFPALGDGSAEYLEITRILLAAGTDLHAHKRGKTALHLAAQGGQAELAELLLDRGADANAKTFGKTPETPLALAVKAKQEKVAALLRARGGR